MMAGFPPISTRIPSASEFVGFAPEGLCAAWIEFLASRPLTAGKVWVRGAPNVLLWIPIVTNLALQGQEQQVFDALL